jgi:heme/copper-type cytochrome/quinol oxidase subunit 2
MDQVDVTWARALKVWWSFAWRASLLIFLVMFPLEAILMFFFMRYMPQPGHNLDPRQGMRMVSTMMVMWPLFMALMVALQAIGMRWMLRSAHWSDFRLAVLPPEQ